MKVAVVPSVTVTSSTLTVGAASLSLMVPIPVPPVTEDTFTRLDKVISNVSVFSSMASSMVVISKVTVVDPAGMVTVVGPAAV